MERLDKVLANSGCGTRSEVKQKIRAGRVQVNGNIIKDDGYKVNDTDELILDGKAVNSSKYRYFMLNKPAGIVSATDDGKDKTVIDLFKKENIKGLFPVGRLDKDTTGLLIVTNDGEFGHRMTSPNHNVDKVYEASVDGILDDNSVQAFSNGFEFKDFTSKPAHLEILSVDNEKKTSIARVTIHEGKFHQVKRMFAKVGCEVTALKRLSMGDFLLDETLAEGEYKELFLNQ